MSLLRISSNSSHVFRRRCNQIVLQIVAMDGVASRESDEVALFRWV